MQLGARHRAYWRYTRILSASLLAVWFLVTFSAAWYATDLNQISFMGFPLAFYLFAQGILLLYLVIVGAYVLLMNRLDRAFGVGEKRPR